MPYPFSNASNLSNSAPINCRLQAFKQRYNLLGPRHAAQPHLLGLGAARLGFFGRILQILRSVSQYAST